MTPRGQSSTLHLTLKGSFIPDSFSALTGDFDLTPNFFFLDVRPFRCAIRKPVTSVIRQNA